MICVQVTDKNLESFAESMECDVFISQLDIFNIEYEFDSVDNILDYNEGMVNIIVRDRAYLFIDGKLDSVN